MNKYLLLIIVLAVSTTHAEEKVHRKSMFPSFTKSTESTQSWYRVSDMKIVGKRLYKGRQQNVGQFSISNKTAEILTVSACSNYDSRYIDIPPNSASNHIIIRAEKGTKLTISKDKHREMFTW